MSKMDHLGIAVRSIEQAARLYVQGLGLRLERVEVVPEQGVKVGFLPLGEVEIEFLEPLSAESAVARFLEKRGEGLHHICLAVEDLEAAIPPLRAAGARFLSDEPRVSASGARYIFIHPQSANGVLLELYEVKMTVGDDQ